MIRAVPGMARVSAVIVVSVVSVVVNVLDPPGLNGNTVTVMITALGMLCVALAVPRARVVATSMVMTGVVVRRFLTRVRMRVLLMCSVIVR